MIKLEGGLVDEKTLINLHEFYEKINWEKKNNFPSPKYKILSEEVVEEWLKELKRAIDYGYDFLGEDVEGTQVYLRSSEINLQ